jgi:hypothetical protein
VRGSPPPSLLRATMGELNAYEWVTAEPSEELEVAGHGHKRLGAEGDRGILNDGLPGVDVGRRVSAARQLHAGGLRALYHR